MRSVADVARDVIAYSLALYQPDIIRKGVMVQLDAMFVRVSNYDVTTTRPGQALQFHCVAATEYHSTTHQGMLMSLRRVIKADIMVSYARVVVMSYPSVGRMPFGARWHAIIQETPFDRGTQYRCKYVHRRGNLYAICR
jgi:hypothetical protein